MSFPKIYLGVPTDGTNPTEYARQLCHHLHILFQLAYHGRPKPVTDEQLAAFLAVDKLKDELLRIAYPPNRGKGKS